MTSPSSAAAIAALIEVWSQPDWHTVMVSAWAWNVSSAVMLAETAVNVLVGFFVMSGLSLEIEMKWCCGGIRWFRSGADAPSAKQRSEIGCVNRAVAVDVGADG